MIGRLSRGSNRRSRHGPLMDPVVVGLFVAGGLVADDDDGAVAGAGAW